MDGSVVQGPEVEDGGVSDRVGAAEAFWRQFDARVVVFREAMLSAQGPEEAGRALMQAGAFFGDMGASLWYTAGHAAGYWEGLQAKPE